MKYLKKFESREEYFKEVIDFDYNKLINLSHDVYDKLCMVLDESVQEQICEYELTDFQFIDIDDSVSVEVLKVLHIPRDEYIIVAELDDEWFVVERVIQFGESPSKIYLCDQFEGLERLIDELVYL